MFPLYLLAFFNTVFIIFVCRMNVEDVSKFACSIALGFLVLAVLCAFLDMVVHHSGQKESGVDVCLDLGNIYPLVTFRWTDVSVEFQSSEIYPIFRESFVAINVGRIVDDALFQMSCSSAESRQYTSEVSGTMVHGARTADREVQRDDGKKEIASDAPEIVILLRSCALGNFKCRRK